MSTDKKVELERTREAIEHFRQQEARLSEELGEPSHFQVVGGHTVPSADAFDALLPSELRKLYDEDKPRWEALMKAKEREGMRRLLNRD